MIEQIRAIQEQAKRKKAEKEWLPRIHHILMKEYGWIPFEEFKKLPMTTIFSLLNQILQEKEAERREMQKIKKPRMPHMRRR